MRMIRMALFVATLEWLDNRDSDRITNLRKLFRKSTALHIRHILANRRFPRVTID